MFSKNRVPWIVGAVLILAFAVGAFAMGGGEEKKKGPASKPETARAVIMPGDRARTLVVAPCQTPIEDSIASARAGRGIPGATTVQLPRGEGERTVLVAHCQPGTGSTTLDGTIPSAAFVLGATQRLPETEAGIDAGGFTARSQLVVNSGTEADTVVVQGCAKKSAKEGRDAVLGGGSARVAPAPAC